MDRKDAMVLAESIIAGRPQEVDSYRRLMAVPAKNILEFLPAADLIRAAYCGRQIHLCTIVNGKSGRCSENCKFCAQSASHATEAPIYPLLGTEDLFRVGWEAAQTPIHRYSIVTSGKRLPREEVLSLAQTFQKLSGAPIACCASFGILEEDDLQALKKAGVSRYHHNLETARSHFPLICTTHTYDARVRTIVAAQKAGLSVCAGGIFGIGESDGQVLELALALKALDVDAVPLNFLVPIKGTPLFGRPRLTPLQCLKIIVLFRFVLPDKDILICGGRELNLQGAHKLIFQAGASGIMTGNYLTAAGRTLEQDLALLDHLGLESRSK